MNSSYYEKGHAGYRMADLAATDSRIANIVGCVKGVTPLGGRILDMGCGDAFLHTTLPDFVYTGMDIDATARPDITHDFSKAPYPLSDEAFDTVICTEVLEHLWEPEIAIGEIYRVLKSGGSAVITTPNFDNIDFFLNHHDDLLYDKTKPHTVEHIRNYTPKSMTKLLQSFGFTVERVLGNSAHMSQFFMDARRALKSFLEMQGLTPNDHEVDQVIGTMFPTICPGFLILARKSVNGR